MSRLPALLAETILLGTAAGRTCRASPETQPAPPPAPNPVETRTYDAVGNLTDDGTYEYHWDVWGRLVRVHSTAAAEDVILRRYNGLGMRIATLTDTDASGVLDGDDDWRYFAYTVAGNLVEWVK